MDETLLDYARRCGELRGRIDLLTIENRALERENAELYRRLAESEVGRREALGCFLAVVAQTLGASRAA